MLLILLSSFFLGSLSKTWTIDGLIPLYRNGTQIYLYSVHRNKSQEVHLKSILESIASQSIRLIEYSTGWHHCPKVCVCVSVCHISVTESHPARHAVGVGQTILHFHISLSLSLSITGFHCTRNQLFRFMELFLDHLGSFIHDSVDDGRGDEGSSSLHTFYCVIIGTLSACLSVSYLFLNLFHFLFLSNTE